MISVIIPNYNHARYLKKRIDSVLNQSYRNFEIIILDDCSSDNSKDIIESYRNEIKVKHIIYNDVNSGSTFKQWQKGIELAKGEYIWIAESDDWADPLLLDCLMNPFLEDKDIVISYCQSYRVDTESVIKGNWIEQTQNLKKGNLFCNDFILKGNLFIQDFLIEQNVIPNASAVLFKKEAYLKVGEVDSSIKYCADWLLWLKMMTIGNIFFSCKPLNYFRFHKDSVIATAGRLDNSFCKKYDIIMRESYLSFLEKNYNKRFKKILILEREYLSKDSYIETLINKHNKKYLEMSLYLLKSLQYSTSKKELLRTIIKRLMRF